MQKYDPTGEVTDGIGVALVDYRAGGSYSRILYNNDVLDEGSEPIEDVKMALKRKDIFINIGLRTNLGNVMYKHVYIQYDNNIYCSKLKPLNEATSPTLVSQKNGLIYAGARIVLAANLGIIMMNSGAAGTYERIYDSDEAIYNPPTGEVTEGVGVVIANNSTKEKMLFNIIKYDYSDIG